MISAHPGGETFAKKAVWCRYGSACKSGTACQFCHTDEEFIRASAMKFEQASPGVKDKAALYKKHLCTNWASTGICRFGDRCTFAHGIEDQQQSLLTTTKASSALAPAALLIDGPRNPSGAMRQALIEVAGPMLSTKAEMCPTFFRDGACPNACCPYGHGLKEINQANEAIKAYEAAQKMKSAPIPPMKSSVLGLPSTQSPPPVSKTQLCPTFLRDGKCPRAALCPNAHSVKEMNQAKATLKAFEAMGSPKAATYKTVLCKYFLDLGYCRQGEECTFAHGTNEQEMHLKKKREMEDLQLRLQQLQTQTSNARALAHRSPTPPQQSTDADFSPVAVGDRHPRTVMCSKWYDGDSCPKGDKCIFAHGEKEKAAALCMIQPSLEEIEAMLPKRQMRALALVVYNRVNAGLQSSTQTALKTKDVDFIIRIVDQFLELLPKDLLALLRSTGAFNAKLKNIARTSQQQQQDGLPTSATRGQSPLPASTANSSTGPTVSTISDYPPKASYQKEFMDASPLGAWRGAAPPTPAPATIVAAATIPASMTTSTPSSKNPAKVDKQSTELSEEKPIRTEPSLKQVLGVLGCISQDTYDRQFVVLWDAILANLPSHAKTLLPNIAQDIYLAVMGEPAHITLWLTMCLDLNNRLKELDEKTTQRGKAELQDGYSSALRSALMAVCDNCISDAETHKLPNLSQISDPDDREKAKRAFQDRLNMTCRFLGELFNWTLASGPALQTIIDRLLFSVDHSKMANAGLLDALISLLVTIAGNVENSEMERYRTERAYHELGRLATVHPDQEMRSKLNALVEMRTNNTWPRVSSNPSSTAAAALPPVVVSGEAALSTVPRKEMEVPERTKDNREEIKRGDDLQGLEANPNEAEDAALINQDTPSVDASVDSSHLTLPPTSVSSVPTTAIDSVGPLASSTITEMNAGPRPAEF